MPKLGDLEREVMDELWSGDQALTVREVHARLARGSDLAYTTVMTVLERLRRKGMTMRVREGKAFRYSAAARRDELAAELMHEALAGAGEDRTAALVHFAQNVTPAEATALRHALAAIDAASASPARRRT